MKENIFGSIVLMLWLGVLYMGISLLCASLPRISKDNPYFFNQIAYYIGLPLMFCSIIGGSLFHIRQVRRSTSAFDPAIYMVLYLVVLIVLVPYMIFYTGGI